MSLLKSCGTGPHSSSQTPKEVIVSGGGDYNNKDFLFRALDAYYKMGLFDALVQGGAHGADRLAQEWALSRKVPSEQVSAAWNLYGNRAGVLRNRAMAKRPDVCLVIAFSGGRGTENMVAEAGKNNLKVIDLRGKENAMS